PDDDDKYAIYLNRGAMSIRQERLSEAMVNLREAVKLKSDRYHPYANLALVYQEYLALPVSGASTVALLAAPLGQGPFLAAAVISERTNQLQRAIELINKAIKLSPILEPLYQIRAQLHMELDDSQAALSDLEEAIREGRSQKTLTLLAASTAGLLGSS